MIANPQNEAPTTVARGHHYDGRTMRFGLTSHFTRIITARHNPLAQMNMTRCAIIVLTFAVLRPAPAATHERSALTPVHNNAVRNGYTIETVGDTLGQASAQNTRLIIRVFGPDKKLVKPAQIGLVDKSGAMIKPIFREDRKVGHEENTGLPLSLNRPPDSGLQVGPVGLDFNKVFGPKGSYSYTKVDWPRSVFTADKQFQIVLPNGQTFVLPLTAIAK